MHIPDNYLSPQSCAALGLVMVPIWAVGLRKIAATPNRDQVPLLGIGAAFSFLVMLFNVPLPGGTTGHAVGGTLVACLLGPWQAAIAISVALLVQAFLFGDGGILSLAANCFNMAIVVPFVGFYTYRFLSAKLRSDRLKTMVLAFAAWSSLGAGALAAALEFGLQPLLFHDLAGAPLYCPYPWSIAVPAMLLPHLAVAGVVEAIFTVAVFRFLSRAAPEYAALNQNAGTMATNPVGQARFRRAAGGIIALLAALCPLGLLASGTAWGEWASSEIAAVTQNGHQLGFVPAGMANGFRFPALAQGYGFSDIPGPLGYILSAVAGVALLLILFKLGGLFIASRKGKKPS